MAEKLKVSDEELEEIIFKYCRDFTALAREGRFGPITGRDPEIRQTILVLLQKGRKNVAVLAPAGVGKTALVAGLAQAVVAEKVPDYLKGARVIEVDLPSMAAGTSSNAEFQARFIPLCRALAERYHRPEYPKFILFIDEMHTIMPMVESAYRGLSEVLKPYLTVGDLHVIGATTLDEFRMFVAVDPAMDRRFQQVPLKVPTSAETVEILKALRPGLEKHHQIKLPDNCLVEIVRLTDKYLLRRNQPDKSIVMLDASCALSVMENGRGVDLDEKYLREIVAIECKLHPDALREDKTGGGH